MKKYLVVLLHIGFWACYLLLVLIMVSLYYRSGLYDSSRESRINIALQNIFLFPKYLQRKKFFLSLIVGVLISVTGAVAGYTLHRYLIESGYVVDMDQGGRNGRSTAVRVILIMTIIGAICGAVALVIKGFITWFNEIKLRELLREKNHAMELALIKSQIDPHLLFNTINNIDSLILKDAVAASNYLNKLSDIMRFVLYETTAERILLSQEIEYLEKYIDLQKIRTANKTYVHFEVTGSIGSKRIAPMVFIPFIENAFKHTNNKKVENAITINIIGNVDTVQLICKNKFGSTLTKQPVGGLGNELIKKRLALLYTGKYTLDVQKNDDLYTVNLTIPND